MNYWNAGGDEGKKFLGMFIRYTMHIRFNDLSREIVIWSR